VDFSFDFNFVFLTPWLTRPAKPARLLRQQNGVTVLLGLVEPIVRSFRGI